MKIFDSFHRSDSTPARENESHARFLNRVHTPYWQNVRDVTESWFSRLCADSQRDIKSRLRDDDNSQFLSAFWELYLHESLLKAGYIVECHPELAGTTRRPDFLAVSKEQSFYLEARRLDTSSTVKAAENRKNQVFDGIQKVNSPNFFLHITVHQVGASSPPLRELRKALEEWLSTLDPDAVTRQIERDSSLNNVPSYVWRLPDGWSITFKPWPKAEGVRGARGIRTIGAYGGDIGFVDDISPIRKALAEKGSAYGDMGLPFVIAVYTSFVGPDPEDISDALYGAPQLEIKFKPNGDIESRPTQAFDGYYHDGTSWLHRNVSGVLVGVDVVPGAGTVRNVPVLWEHPGALNPFVCPPMWGRKSITEDRLAFEPPKISMHKMLGLREDWPPGRPFDPYI